jgi:hypothetical protein
MHTCITQGSNRIFQASHVPSFPPHYTITRDSMGYAIFYINFEINLYGWPHYHP